MGLSGWKATQVCARCNLLIDEEKRAAPWTQEGSGAAFSFFDGGDGRVKFAVAHSCISWPNGYDTECIILPRHASQASLAREASNKRHEEAIFQAELKRRHASVATQATPPLPTTPGSVVLHKGEVLMMRTERGVWSSQHHTWTDDVFRDSYWTLIFDAGVPSEGAPS